jgi:hypothetical protein
MGNHQLHHQQYLVVLSYCFATAAPFVLMPQRPGFCVLLLLWLLPACFLACWAGRALLSHKKGSTEPEPRHNQHPKAILITNYAGWSDIGDVTDDALLSGRRLNAAGEGGDG